MLPRTFSLKAAFPKSQSAENMQAPAGPGHVTKAAFCGKLRPSQLHNLFSSYSQLARRLPAKSGTEGPRHADMPTAPAEDRAGALHQSPSPRAFREGP